MTKVLTAEGLESLIAKTSARLAELNDLNNKKTDRFYQIPSLKSALQSQHHEATDGLTGRLTALDEAVDAEMLSIQDRDERARPIKAEMDAKERTLAESLASLDQEAEDLMVEVNENIRSEMRKLMGRLEQYQEMLDELAPAFLSPIEETSTTT